MNRPLNDLFKLQRLVADFALVERHHQVLDSDRQESDVEHSFSVALLCWYILSKYKLELNIELCLKYALAHDFVEVYAGDTNTFASEAERNSKIVRERKAVDKLSSEFATFPEMLKVIEGYEDKSTDEALFVWTVDKLQALILGDLDNWRPYKKLDISFAAFSNKYAELLEKSSPYCREIFDTVIEYTKTTYYDQPKK